MLRTMNQFVNDDAGFIISAELVLVATIVVIGIIVGLSEVQTALVTELNDLSCAIGSLNQSYSFKGFTGCKAVTAGSSFQDSVDVCDSNCNTDLCAGANSTIVGEGGTLPAPTP